jgi:hypothetical protein
MSKTIGCRPTDEDERILREASERPTSSGAHWAFRIVRSLGR